MTHVGEPIEKPEAAQGEDMEGGRGGLGTSPHEAATLLLQHLQVGFASVSGFESSE